MMTGSLLVAQLFNGIQLGMLLFLLSAGLTLVLGIMNFVNLAHGSLYMVGAYLAASTMAWTGSFLAAGFASVVGTLLIGIALERLVFSRLYDRDHLDQVLATFALVLIFNEVVRVAWGPATLTVDVPALLAHTVRVLGLPYAAYRFAVIAVGLVTGGLLYLLIHRSHAGILIRAGASNPVMTAALGINVRKLKMLVVGLGAGLAGLAGLMAGPLTAVQAGMGEPILVLTLVVIVTGGIGSVRGAFYGALIVGLIDTGGRTLLPLLLREIMDRSMAQSAGPAIASILIYVAMAIILVIRPMGLFPVRYG